jgi:hypothetical protein
MKPKTRFASGAAFASVFLLRMLSGGTGAAAETASAVETILFIRHGEKPVDGLGQLSCRGLNRSLAIPAVLRRKYGRLDAVFAPNPAEAKSDGPGDDEADRASYDYVRPLATAEPTAVGFGLPIHAAIGFRETEKLQAALLEPRYRGATVLVAWEHHMIREVVKGMLRDLGGEASAVPKWPSDDFDSIWRVTIERTATKTNVLFARDTEDLDGQSETCPTR